jgi:hypothetical protein
MSRRGSRKKTVGLNVSDDSLRAAIRRANSGDAPAGSPAQPGTSRTKQSVPQKP